MLRQNKLVFYFPLKKLVWKILIHQATSTLVLELRDEESREVSFTAIDLISKKQLWNNLPVKENWWLGLDALGQGMVILHGYKDIQHPEHQGIYVFDLLKGKYLWENKAYTFIDLVSKGIAAYKADDKERAIYFLNFAGEEKGLLNENELSVTEEPSHITNSLHYTKENKYFEKISRFIIDFTGKQPEAVIDYLEHKSKIIISFYFKENEKLVNYLMVINENGEILLEDRIGEEMQGIGMDTFFLFKDLLIFVKNKKELAIFEL